VLGRYLVIYLFIVVLRLLFRPAVRSLYFCIAIFLTWIRPLVIQVVLYFFMY